MFDLDEALRDWRMHMERGTALSAREVDELEDHLRASIELEQELDATLTPARACSLARDEVGEATALSREFAKSGSPRWRLLLLVGSGMFAASWFLPALSDETPFGRWWGWEAFLAAVLQWDSPVYLLSAVTNVLMVFMIYRIRRVRPLKNRWLTWCVTGAAALNLLCWIRLVDILAVGFWVWAGSFILAASALWMQDREWASAKL